MDRRTTLVAGGVMAAGLGVAAPRVATRCATSAATRTASTLVDDAGRVGASVADDALLHAGTRPSAGFVDDAARAGAPRGVPAGAGLADDTRMVWGPAPREAALGRFGRGFVPRTLTGESRLGDEVLQQVIETGVDGTLSIIDDAAVALDDETAARARVVVKDAPVEGAPLLLDMRDVPDFDAMERWPSGAPLAFLVTSPDEAVGVRFTSRALVPVAAVHGECVEQETACIVLVCPEPEESCRSGVLDAWSAAEDATHAYGEGAVDAFLLRLIDELDRRPTGRLWVSQLRVDPDPAGSVERVVLELHPRDLGDAPTGR